jgi:hypothetical protein
MMKKLDLFHATWEFLRKFLVVQMETLKIQSCFRILNMIVLTTNIDVYIYKKSPLIQNEAYCNYGCKELMMTWVFNQEGIVCLVFTPAIYTNCIQ